MFYMNLNPAAVWIEAAALQWFAAVAGAQVPIQGRWAGQLRSLTLTCSSAVQDGTDLVASIRNWQVMNAPLLLLSRNASDSNPPSTFKWS